MFAAIREVVADNADMVTFIDHELELLNKKSSAERKPTATQIENENFKKLIFNHLVELGTAKCIKELQTDIPEIAELSNQRVTHLMTALIKENKITKEYVKKTPFYSAILD